jgi:hypothetical protein
MSELILILCFASGEVIKEKINYEDCWDLIAVARHSDARGNKLERVGKGIISALSCGNMEFVMQGAKPCALDMDEGPMS